MGGLQFNIGSAQQVTVVRECSVLYLLSCPICAMVTPDHCPFDLVKADAPMPHITRCYYLLLHPQRNRTIHLQTPCHAYFAHSLAFNVYFTIKTDDGTSPASFKVLEKSTLPSKVCRGNVVVKLATALPVSACSSCASSNRVVSAGSVFMMLPESV